jgi:transcription initiation factor TFIIIB Brf1 subunit/transcription initiation factor TFIIB
MISPINNKQYHCDYCHSKNLTISTGFKVCRDCGTVKDKVYEESSFQYYQKSESSSSQSVSAGKKLTQVGSLGSEIGYYKNYQYHSYNGENLPNNIKYKFLRLEKNYHSPLKIASSQTHLRTFIIFNSICEKLGIQYSTKERTSYLYWKYVNNKDVKLTNHVLLIALCLLYAIREQSDRLPIKFQEIIRAFSEAGHRVTNKNILNLANQIGLNLNKASIRKSEDYIERIANTIIEAPGIENDIYSKLTLNSYKMLLIKLSNYFLEYLDEHIRGGVQPFGYACAVIYLADRGIARFFKKIPVLTQKKVAKITNSKEYTIRDHCYNSLTKEFNKLKFDINIMIENFIKNV